MQGLRAISSGATTLNSWRALKLKVASKVFKDIWSPLIGEQIKCTREVNYPRVCYAVAVIYIYLYNDMFKHSVTKIGQNSFVVAK